MTTKKVKTIEGIMFFVIALAALTFSITCFVYGGESYVRQSSSYVYHEEYGGDAYTGIQNAAADTANNVRDLVSLNSEGFTQLYVYVFRIAAFAFLMAALVFIALGVKRMLEANIKENAKISPVVAVDEQPVSTEDAACALAEE